MMTKVRVATLGKVAVTPVPAASKSTSRRLLAGVLGLLILGGSAVVAAAYRSSQRLTHDAESGPVTAGGGKTMTGIKVEVGQVFTFGGVVLYNSADKPAVLESIAFDPPLSPDFDVVDVKAAGRDRRTGFVGADQVFPPEVLRPQSLRAVEGAIVPARSDDPEGWGVELVFGLKVTRPGKFLMQHVVVDYRIDGKRHRVRLDDGFVACAPARDFAQGCTSDARGAKD
jgi:hypothetical protein